MAKSEETKAMNLLIHTLVTKVDQMGKGVDLIEHLGQDRFKDLMSGYREHERTAEK